MSCNSVLEIELPFHCLAIATSTFKTMHNQLRCTTSSQSSTQNAITINSITLKVCTRLVCIKKHKKLLN